MVKAYDPIKVQSSLLKIKTSTRSQIRYVEYMYGRCAGCIWLMPNTCMAYVIPEEDFYLDLNMVFPDKKPYDVHWLFEESKKSDGAYYAGEKRVKKLGVTQTIEVYKLNEGRSEVWVDRNLVKEFDHRACAYSMIDSKSPLFIWDKETMALIGAVLPISQKPGSMSE